MAPVLLCPECGTKHPLDNVAEIPSFPCTGCGRTLKVPAQARELSAARNPNAGSPPAAAPAAAAPEAHATQVLATPAPPMAVTAPAPAPATAAAAATAVPPLGPPQAISRADYARPRVAVEPDSAKEPAPVPPAVVRFLLWLVAVPLAFIVVFGVARGFGLLTTNEITDVALAEGWGRFWPIVRLLPFIALVTALLVTGGVYGITWLRARQKAKRKAAGPQKTPVDHESRTLV